MKIWERTPKYHGYGTFVVSQIRLRCLAKVWVQNEAAVLLRLLHPFIRHWNWWSFMLMEFVSSDLKTYTTKQHPRCSQSGHIDIFCGNWHLQPDLYVSPSLQTSRIGTTPWRALEWLFTGELQGLLGPIMKPSLLTIREVCGVFTTSKRTVGWQWPGGSLILDFKSTWMRRPFAWNIYHRPLLHRTDVFGCLLIPTYCILHLDLGPHFWLLTDVMWCLWRSKPRWWKPQLIFPVTTA